MAEQRGIRAESAINVTGPIRENDRTVVSSSAGVPDKKLGGPTQREFEGRLSAAESVIGSNKLQLAHEFNECVQNSRIEAQVRQPWQTLDNQIGKTEVPVEKIGTASSGDIDPISGASRVSDLITAQCAAKVYAGPSGGP